VGLRAALRHGGERVTVDHAGRHLVRDRDPVRLADRAPEHLDDHDRHAGFGEVGGLDEDTREPEDPGLAEDAREPEVAALCRIAEVAGVSRLARVPALGRLGRLNLRDLSSVSP